jgi:hypothetical protein
MFYMHFLSFFQSRIHTVMRWYVNFLSPYVDSSISANYMVDVDIYIHASASWSWGSIVGMATRLQAGQSGVRILVGARDFSLLQNIHTVSGTHPASCSVGMGILSQGKAAGT